MFALLLCVLSEPACLALSAARIDPQGAIVIVTDTANRTTVWRAPVAFQTAASGRIEVNLPPLMRGGFE